MTAQERIASLSTPAWTLAALAASVESGLAAALDEPRDAGELAERTGLPVAVVEALVEVLATMELAERIGEHWVAGPELEPAMCEPDLGLLRDDLRTTLLQSHALFTAARVEPDALGRWRHTDEELLQAQGRLSASVIPMLAQVLFPHVPGLLDRLGSEVGAFLDVGAGVAAVSIAMCRQYPAIRAVGLEPAPAIGAWRSSTTRRPSTWRGCPRASSPPTRSPQHWAPCTARCARGACCSPARSTRAVRMPRRRSPGCASRSGAATAWPRTRSWP